MAHLAAPPPQPRRAAPTAGFSLIELLVVVAIVGLLATLALPVYHNYTARARAAELLVAAGECRSEITQALQISTGAQPLQFVCGTPSALPHSQHVFAKQGVALGWILVVPHNIDPVFDNHMLVLRPVMDSAQTPLQPWAGSPHHGKNIYAWRCGPYGPDASALLSMLPSSCRDVLDRQAEMPKAEMPKADMAPAS